jgi:4'-phosphopantetheinyl transferase
VSPTLAPGRVQVWWGRPAELTPDGRARLWSLLPDDERAAITRLAFDEDRRTSLLARGMVRHVLTEVTGALPPDGWRFSRTALGRPLIANPEFDWLTFNISHTRQLVVCAVAARAELGVDIESLERQAPIDVADRYFSSFEAQDVRSLPPARRARRFFEYWTLKEAFVKARSLGLTLPLDGFTLAIGEPGAIRITFADEPAFAGEDPARWRFHSGEIAPSHLLAVAFAPTGGEALALELREARPLLDRAAST